MSPAPASEEVEMKKKVFIFCAAWFLLVFAGFLCLSFCSCVLALDLICDQYVIPVLDDDQFFLSSLSLRLCD